MKKLPKRLGLTTETIRVLQTEELTQIHGGTTGTSIINPTPNTSIVQTTATSIILPTIGQTGTSIIRTR